MPELPEVEIFREYVESNALNQKITEVEVLKPKILEGIDPDTLKKRLTGHAFDEAKRYGKYLFIRLDGKKPAGWAVFHFGMTGFLKYSGQEVPITEQTAILNKKADHVRVRIAFENGQELLFDELRMFGKMGFAESPDDYLKARKLGPDALTISAKDFTERLAKRKGQIKPTLMDQSFVAGPGNVYVDEALFQCGIHPESRVQNLSGEDVQCLYKQTVDVLRKTVAVKANRKKLPKGYLTHQRKKNGECPRDKTKLEVKTVGGRTTYFCPACQKLL